MRSSDGYRSTLALMCLAQLLSWAILYYAFASMLLPMQRELGWTQPQMMGAYTLALAAWGVGSYAAGAWIDRGRERAVIAGSAVLAATALLLWSRAQALWQLYLALLLCGVAMAGSLYDAAFAAMTRRYPDRYRHAVSALTLLGGLASTLAFPALAWLVPRWGWRATLAALAALMAGVAAAQAVALRPAARAPAAAGEEGGGGAVAPGSGAVSATPSAASAGARASVDSGSARGAAAPLPAGVRFADALRGSAFWLLTLCFTAHAFVVAGFWAHAMAAFAARGWSAEAAVAVLAWIGPAQVAGRAAMIVLGRRWSSRRVGRLVLAGTPLAMLVFAAGDSRAALLGFALLYGASAGMATIVRGSSVPETFGALEVGRIGGALAAISLGGRAAAPLLCAWGVAALGGYRELALALALLGAAGWLCYVGVGAGSASRLG